MCKHNTAVRDVPQTHSAKDPGNLQHKAELSTSRNFTCALRRLESLELELRKEKGETGVVVERAADLIYAGIPGSGNVA